MAEPLLQQTIDRNNSCLECGGPCANRYCSVRCMNVYQGRRRTEESKRRRERECQHCGGIFYARSNTAGLYCSRDCSFAVMAVRSGIAAERSLYERWSRVNGYNGYDCIVCGVQLTGQRRKVCGMDCVRELTRRAYYKKYRKRQEPRSCRECSVVFTPISGNSKYCTDACRKRHTSRVYKGVRRARLRRANYEIVDPLVVFNRDGWRCQACGQKTPKRLRGSYEPYAPELDHIIPISRGGEHTYRNTQCLCRSCNQSKSDGPGGQLRMFG